MCDRRKKSTCCNQNSGNTCCNQNSEHTCCNQNSRNTCCGQNKEPECCGEKIRAACAAPTPRETNNYYSRNHKKKIFEDCKGSCYCPEGCSCPNEGRKEHFADSNCSDMDEDCCCCPKRNNRNRNESCCPCEKPYCPPCRKPICYPPIKCCEDNCESPDERICYYPCPVPPQPKFCTCGQPNPCNCDLNLKRRKALCEKAPCCRRCGRKVYVAERIMAANGSFHSSCFSCYCCHKPLEVTNVFENQGEIYCKKCYAKFFGVRGYGYGATLLSPL